jgi:nitronate monooxygenase
VNDVAGGHAGRKSPEALLDELAPFGLPVVCAGGVGDAATFRRMMALGYDAVQMGTRFIATTECLAHPDYKAAIVRAAPEDIVLTERVSGVPLAVILNDHVRKVGLRAGAFVRWMLRGRRRKRLMRVLLGLRSHGSLKRGALSARGAEDYWQAGKSVGGIRTILPAAEVVSSFAAALESPIDQ